MVEGAEYAAQAAAADRAHNAEDLRENKAKDLVKNFGRREEKTSIWFELTRMEMRGQNQETILHSPIAPPRVSENLPKT